MAIEQFRDKRFQNRIRLKLKTQNKIVIWEANTQELIQHCQRITESYLEMGIKITLRQLYYDLVSEKLIPNHDTIYKKFSSLLTDARYCGLIDWEALEDRNRPSDMHSEWDDVHELIQSAIASYRLPRWNDQEYYIELFTEKDALSSIIQPICNKWHIRFNVNKGYSSASIMYQLAQRLAEKIKDGKKVLLLYVGDHDPSGLDMVRDVEARVNEFLKVWVENYFWETEHENKDSDWYRTEEMGHDGWRWFFETDYLKEKFTILPIALTMEQINTLHPPPNPAKITDPRAKWYISNFGEESWEVEALKPNYLIELINETVKKYVDIDDYNRWLDLEKEHKKEMDGFAKEWKKKQKEKDE